MSATGPVVKLHVKSLASALPATSVTPVVTTAVYRVFAARLAVGVNVATLELTLTVPATGAPPAVDSLKVAAVRVDFSIPSEKVTLTVELTPTEVAPLDGDVAETTGGVVSAAGVVAVATFDCPETFLLESNASTVYEYCVDGESPVSSNDVSPVTVAIRVPPRRTV